MGAPRRGRLVPTAPGSTRRLMPALASGPLPVVAAPACARRFCTARAPGRHGISGLPRAFAAGRAALKTPLRTLCRMSPAAPETPRAKKSLGQHFLRNEGVCRRIAAQLHPQPEDKVLEIGPGPGALTRALEAQPHERLLLLEKDRHWAAERQRAAAPGTQAVLMDALRFDWRRLAAEAGWKIAGNLPYNVASPLIWDIVSQSGAARCVFMVQKEVGQRLCAAPGSRQYGALSVWVQAYARPRLEFTLGPGAFSPPPKVDSAVLSFTPLPQEVRPRHPGALERLLRICFQQRRKQLAGIFARAGLKRLAAEIPALGLSPQLRPEALSVGDFLRLSALLAEMTGEGKPHEAER